MIATDVCGYAPFVVEAAAGLLVPSPFQQETYNQILETAMASPDLIDWSKNGIAFAAGADIYDMPIRAADYICVAS